MKKISLVMLLFTLILSTAHAVDQHQVLHYDYEENGGSIILDSSGNNNHGIVNNGRWQTTASAFGTYGFDFDGANDWIDVIVPATLGTEFSVASWVKPDSDSSIVTMLHTEDTGIMGRFQLENDQFLDTFSLHYIDDSSSPQTLVLGSALAPGVFTHIAISIDAENNLIKYYNDNNLILDVAVPNGYQQTVTPSISRIGATLSNQQDYDGDIDETFVFDFLISDTQVSELFNTNTLTLILDPIAPESPLADIENLVSIDLINSFTPSENETMQSSEKFNINLNTVGSCEIYVENELYKIVEGQIAYTVSQNLNAGDHNYFLYCYYDNNNTRYFELTDLISFTVENDPPGTITLNLRAEDFDPNGLALYFTTPCMEQGIYLPGISPKYSAAANPDGIYFQRIVDNSATFTVDAETHEFCLVNGQIFYDQNGPTTNYHPNVVHNQIELGEFDVPSNLTSAYTVSVENFDMYGKANPKAWGQSWISLIGAIISLLLGLGILALGVTQKIPQAVLIGGLLVLFALGFEIANILLVAGGI